MANEKVQKFRWGSLKLRKFNLALITTHAKLKMSIRGGSKTFSPPMKSMAERTLKIHFSKAVNLPCWIKRLASNGKICCLW